MLTRRSQRCPTGRSPAPSRPCREYGTATFCGSHAPDDAAWRRKAHAQGRIKTAVCDRHALDGSNVCWRLFLPSDLTGSWLSCVQS
eukprot:2829689-Rhodomonas_salina.1